MRWLGSITDSMDMNLNKVQEIVKDRGAWHAAVHEVAEAFRILVPSARIHAMPRAWK